jgi:autotransporter-associated beta strand protein
VIEHAFSLTIDTNQRRVPGSGWTPAPWVLSAAQPINTNNGYLSVLAPLQGSGGLSKTGLGLLDLTNTNTTTGANTIAGGVVRSNQTSGTPLGSGSLALDYGTLWLRPANIGAAINLSGANGAGSVVSYGGGATLLLDANGNPSLTFSAGGSGGSMSNLLRSGRGTLVIAPGSGTAALGATEQFLVQGGVSVLPTGIVNPSIVGRNNDAGASGDFLTYGTNGFARAAYTLSSQTPIHMAGSNAIYEVNNPQTVNPNSTASVYALKVGPFTVASGGGTTVLAVGSGATGQQSGIILNGGTISTTFLDFDNAEAVIYSSLASGTINSVIRGDGGLTSFGPGRLVLTANNTYRGGTVVQSGTLAAMNTAMNSSDSATGPGPVTVNTEAMLLIAGGAQVTGMVTAQNGGTLALAGGTAAGAVNVDCISFLEGFGTISGPAVINGVINAGPTIGTLTFTDSVTFNGGTVFTWTLGALDDTPGHEGLSWNWLRFTTPDGTLNLGDMPGCFSMDNQFGITMAFASGVPDPNSGHPFWNESHTWLLFEATSATGFDQLNYGRGTGPRFLQGSFQLMDNSTMTMNATQLWLQYTPHGTVVPEPSTVLLLLTGLTGLAAWRGGRACWRHRSSC